MSDVTLHAQGSITGSGRVAQNIQASTTPEEIKTSSTFFNRISFGLVGSNPDDVRTIRVNLQDGGNAYISNNQWNHMRDVLQANPGAYPELSESSRQAIRGR